jgi:hypothetical protein
MNTVLNVKKNLNELSLIEKIELTKNTYAGISYFQQLFNSDVKEFNCEEITAEFRREIYRILIEKNLIRKEINPDTFKNATEFPLEELHRYVDEEMHAYNFDDGVNKISTHFYETDSLFESVYFKFIAFLRKNVIEEPFLFQRIPTIRIHCPNAKNNHHYPRYHSDIAYGHPPQEINIWFPLTDVLTGHGFKLMSLETSRSILDKYLYNFASFIDDAIHNKAFSAKCDSQAMPVTTKLGSILAFDSRNIHSGLPLMNHTRISMDIRVLPISQYEKMPVTYQGSGRRKVLFTPGECYHTFNSDVLFDAQGR